MKSRLVVLLLSLFCPLFAALAENGKDGEVKIPLSEYTRLMEAARNAGQTRPAPSGYALGDASVQVEVQQSEGRAAARVEIALAIRVLENQWTLVPILPPGVAVESVLVNGSRAELITSPQGLSWGARESGAYSMRISYRTDALRSESGYSLALPLPQASAINISALIPGSGLDATVIPSGSTEVKPSGNQTSVQATVPSTTGVQISWRQPSAAGHFLSRAQYTGKLVNDAVTWTADFQVELANDETVTLPLLPETITLSNLRVDGKDSPIIARGGSFATTVKGRGSHKVAAEFQVPVENRDGPPRVELAVRPVPVTRIDLILPGKKEVNVEPASSVSLHGGATETVATAYIPMTENVRLSWSEAVPEEVKTEVRTHSSIYHSAHAEEGVLYMHAMVVYEVSRGEAGMFELEIPKGVEINRIASANGGIADWRIVKGEGQNPDIVNVFLDRKVKDEFSFDVFYDRSLAGSKPGDRIDLPLLRSGKVNRQRGMVALLASKDLTLKPVEEKELTRVGENQLPPFVRQEIKMTVAHTYKYVEAQPQLAVQVAAPEKKQGKFDAVVNTLISLSDVTLKGSASMEMNIKSGAISELQLALPLNVNVLSLTAPSLRSYKVDAQEKNQLVDVQFTQDMEGEFRVEVNYEQITGESKEDTRVPTLSVNGAEVEQGRIAVEALSAVEVQAAQVRNLSSLDPGELPQQLILKTTNPILLSYKYVRTEPAHELALKVTRHREIDVKSATIDRAEYQTLYTRDGLAVTSAKFMVKNTREQFLRVQLPPGSVVWSAYVNGNAEKPAAARTGDKAGSQEDESRVLIKIISSSQGFPVNLVYQTPVSKIGRIGHVQGVLPRPDMIVTESRWDVFLPDEMSYGRADANMQVVAERETVSRGHIDASMNRLATNAGSPVVEPIRHSVPASGVHFAFEKLYANQAEDDAWFSIPYASGFGKAAASVLVALGALMLWLAGLSFAGRVNWLTPAQSKAVSGAGAVILGVLVGWYGASHTPAVLVSIAAAVGIGAMSIAARKVRSSTPADGNRGGETPPQA